MRKKLLFFSLLLTVYFIKAQMWFANGAEWHYYVNHFSISTIGQNGNGHYKITVTNSLTLGGDTCYELTRTFSGIPTWYTYPMVFNDNKGKFLVKVKNNVLSLCTNTTIPSFDTLCDFNATVGAKWKTLNDGSCSASNATTEVVSVSTTTMNNVVLKKISVTSKVIAVIQNSTYTLTTGNTYIEKFGGLNSFYFYNCCNVDCGTSYGTLSCYQDDNFPLYKVPSYTLACNYIPSGVGIKENELLTDIAFYPNPANESLVIFNSKLDEKITQINIFNQLGILVSKQTKEFKDGRTRVDLNGLNQGIYILKLSTEDNRSYTQKIMKE